MYLEKAMLKLEELKEKDLIKINYCKDYEFIKIGMDGDKFFVFINYKTEYVLDDEQEFIGKDLEEVGKKFLDWLNDFDSVLDKQRLELENSLYYT